MEIAVGLLAHNEENHIGITLKSLLSQSIFKMERRIFIGITNIQVVCLPNGCTDRTAERTREIFDRYSGFEGISLQCDELAESGKSRSWNIFVHSRSAKSAKYLILIDADIEFGSIDVLERIIIYLESHPDVVVGTDRPIKITQRKSQRSLQEKLSLAASDQIDTNGRLSGQLYCGRSHDLRQIWMPLSLPVEDGFLAAMISTNGFTSERCDWKIAQVPNAVHYYDAHETFLQFIRHESRIIVGSTINAWLFSLLWAEGKRGHVGDFIKQANETNPNWLEDFTRAQASKKRWLVPIDFVLKRLRTIRGRTIRVKAVMLPIALAATFVQALVCMRANSLLRREGSTSYW